MVPLHTKAELCRTSKAGLFLAESTAGLNTINIFSSLSPWLAFSQEHLSLVPGGIHQEGFQKPPQRMGIDIAGLGDTACERHPGAAAPQSTAWPWQGEQEGSSCWDAAGGSPRTAVTPVRNGKTSQQLPKTELELPWAVSWREVWQQRHHVEIKAE